MNVPSSFFTTLTDSLSLSLSSSSFASASVLNELIVSVFLPLDLISTVSSDTLLLTVVEASLSAFSDLYADTFFSLVSIIIVPSGRTAVEELLSVASPSEIIVSGAAGVGASGAVISESLYVITVVVIVFVVS